MAQSDSTGADPKVGELWSLTWNGELLGHAVVASIHDTFALVWPAVTDEAYSYFPGLIAHSFFFDAPTTVWPTRETGIGIYLLDQNLGELIAPTQIVPISAAIEDGKEAVLPFAADFAGNSSLHRDALDETMLDQWQRLCFLTVSSDHLFFDQDRAKALGIKSKSAADALGFDSKQLGPIWKGEVPIEGDLLKNLEEATGFSADEFLTSDPLGYVLDRISAPEYKQEIKERAALLELDEGEFRRRTRDEFALAARDDSDRLEPQKLRDAIRRVSA